MTVDPVFRESLPVSHPPVIYLGERLLLGKALAETFSP